MKSKLSAILAAVLILVINATPAQAGPQDKPYVSIDQNNPAVYNLIECLTPEELDCVESVKIGTSASALVAMDSVGHSDWTTWTDDNNNQRFSANSEWYLDGLDVPVYVTTELETPSHVIVNDVPNNFFLVGGALRVMPGNVPDGYLVEIKIRTSWLKPQNIQLVADDANFKHEVITGGNAWTFTGKKTSISFYYDWETAWANGLMGQADEDVSDFHFFIHHAGIDDSHSYFDPTCSDLGYTVQAFNSNSAGSPEWNNDAKSIDFSIFAPHMNSHGELNYGFFKLWTTDAFVDCRWPANTLTSADRLVGQVLNPDGTPQDATVTVTHSDGKIFLETTGFHYSQPIIHLQGIQTSVKPVLELKKIEGTGSTRTIGGRNLSLVTALTLNGDAVNYKILSESELSIELPKLALGTYSLDVYAGKGKTTWVNAIKVGSTLSARINAHAWKKVLQFKKGITKLSAAQVQQVTEFAHGATSLTCVGNVAAKGKTKALATLAKYRAANACAAAKFANPKLLTRVEVRVVKNLASGTLSTELIFSN